MVQLTQVFMIYICVALVKGHIFFGNDHHRVHHDITDLPQIISHYLINQNLGQRYPHRHHNHGLFRPGMPGSANFNLGTPAFNYNRPSNIFTGNLFGSPDYTSQEGMFNSEEAGQSSQQPNSGEELPNIQIPQMPSISDGINGVTFDGNQDGTANIFNGNSEANGQNLDFPGQEIIGNMNIDIPNIQIPQTEGIDKTPVNGILTSAVGDQAQDSVNVNLGNSGAAADVVGPVLGQITQVGLPNNNGGSENIQESNQVPINGIITSAVGGQAQAVGGQAQAVGGQAQVESGQAQTVDGQAQAVGGQAQTVGAQAEEGTNVNLSNSGAAIDVVGPVLGQLGQVGLQNSISGSGKIQELNQTPANGIITSALGNQAQDDTNVNLSSSGAAINAVSSGLGQLGQGGLLNSIGGNENIQESNQIPANGIINNALGDKARDDTNTNALSSGTVINAVGTVVGQAEQVVSPSNTGVNDNIEGNKHEISSDVATSGQDNVKVNLNSSSDLMNDSNLHVNAPIENNQQTPGVEISTDSKLEDILKDIFKPDDQNNLGTGIDKLEVSTSGIPPKNIADTSSSKDENLVQNTITGNLTTVKNSSVKKDDSNLDGTLKTNLFVPSNNSDNSDVMISKHKDRSSIVFPDQLSEAKDKQKNESQLSKLNDLNGHFLYAVNIGSAIIPASQGFYVPPTSTDNTQKVYVNSPSSTPVQYVPPSPSNTVSSSVPSSNVVSTNANGGSQGGGYTLVNYPTNGNGNSGQASYNTPISSGGQSNGYYQIPSNPSQQAYYTVQLSNGQTALVPASSGQYVQSNGHGQIVMPSNGQQYVLSNGQPAQSNGQILYSNGQQFIPSTGQPLQGNGQIVISSNGQQYVPSNVQPMQGNGQIVVASNVQQYVPSNGQPMQGNNQVIMTSNGQQYIPTSSQPQGGQFLISNNGQQYVQSNGQPANGQYFVSSNGQNYVPSGQVSVPWSQGTVQNNAPVFVPLNQNSQGNVITVPAGSIVTVGGSSVPLMVFKDKEESSPKSSSDEEQDDGIVQEKDEIKDERADKLSGNKQNDS